VRTLRGAVVAVEVSDTMPFREIFPRVARELRVSPAKLRLIFKGAAVLGDQTPRSLDVAQGTVLHAVLKDVEVSEAVPRWAELYANCRICNTAGAPFRPRPFCLRCGSESVILVREGAAGARDVFGDHADVAWRDLLGLRVECPIPSCATQGRASPAGIGFVCKADSEGGERCPSTRPVDGATTAGARREREAMRLQYRYLGGGEEEYKRLVNTILGYAHLAGLEDSV
jgi:Ubiquitin family